MNKIISLIRCNIYINTIWLLLLVVFSFTISRILFFFFNYQYFNNLDFFEFLKILFAGLRYDLSAICLLNIPFVFLRTFPFNIRYNKYYEKIVIILFFIINGIALLANCIDIAYFGFTLKRTTADIFYTQGLGNDIINLLPSFIADFWYIPLIFIIIIILLIYLHMQTKNIFIKSRFNLSAFIKQFLIFLFSLALIFILGRGGLQLRPLNIISAGKYTEARNIPLVINTPFAILSTLGKNAIKPYVFFKDDKDFNKFVNTIKKADANSKFDEKNIVIIILESFSSEHIGALNKSLPDYNGYTPFLDSLVDKSAVFINAFANGKKSNEGIAAILAGIPSLMDIPYTSSIYAGNNIAGIATLLKQKSYNSSFFHGGNNGTMGFDAFTKTAGFDKYYGRNEYPADDYDGKWGIWDEEYLQYYADTLNNMQQPFISSVFTLSSHHPFKVPEKHKNKFPEGPLQIHRTIGYTDYALKLFFNEISSKPWFQNTIFLITADHTSEAFIPYYNTRLGIYKVPIIIYGKDVKPKVYTQIIQHIDIMPTLLDLINYDTDFYSLGSSAFDSTAPHFAVNYINNTFQFIQNDYTLEFDGEKTLNLFNFNNDSLLTNNLNNNHIEVRIRMENNLKSFLQIFSKDLRNNNMIIK